MSIEEESVQARLADGGDDRLRISAVRYKAVAVERHVFVIKGR